MDQPLTLPLAFSIVISIAGALFGWMLKTLTSRLEKLDASVLEFNKEMHAELKECLAAISSMRSHLAENYVRHGEFTHALDDLHSVLRRIQSKLERSVATVRPYPDSDYPTL